MSTDDNQPWTTKRGAWIGHTRSRRFWPRVWWSSSGPATSGYRLPGIPSNRFT